MDDASENRPGMTPTILWRGLRPALPAVIGAAALVFLFVAAIPMAWVAAISWNLYLDRLSDLFVPPVGNGGRLALALGMAAVAAVVAGFIALVVTRPEESGLAALRRRFVRGRTGAANGGDEEVLMPRRRADLHPDDAPRPPLRAGRDLPAGGLGPVTAPAASDAMSFEQADAEEADELILADLAPEEAVSAGEEPWLQPAAVRSGAPLPDPSDNSLGAMVARLEAGLSRRRQAGPATAAIPAPEVAHGGAEAEPPIDFALEAALGTLQRMNRQAVG